MGDSAIERVCRRTSWDIAVRCLFANLAGAAGTFLYLELLAPSEQVAEETPFLVDVAIVTLFFLGAVAAVGHAVWRRVDRALAWMPEGRPPTDDEREAALAIPFRSAVGSMVAWVLAAAIFGPGELLDGHSGAHALQVSASILLGGFVSCTISYLLVERACRPVFALALAGGARPTRVTTMSVRTRLVATWALVSGVPFVGLALLPLQARGADVNIDPDGAVVALSVIGLVGGALATGAVARSVAEPLGEVRRAIARVEAGDLSVEVPVDDGGEVGLLQTGVNEMVAGLRERARLADLFGRHVGAEVAALALEQGTGMRSEQREASVLFVDLVGSTAMAEILPPDAVVETLNAYFATVVEVVAAEGGWVNKFEGDGALCVFGAPAVQPDHAARALRAARTLEEQVRLLAARYPGVDAAVGVSSGVVVAGNVGTSARYEYTVIGGPVNEAARLTDLAKGREARVLASDAALARAGEESRHWADAGTVALRGRSQPIAVAEPASGGRRRDPGLRSQPADHRGAGGRG